MQTFLATIQAAGDAMSRLASGGQRAAARHGNDN